MDANANGIPDACEVTFIRGDANGDGVLALEDALELLNHLFADASTSCESALDLNADGLLGLPDPLLVLQYLFLQGPSPVAPFPDCGPPSGALSCDSHPFCTMP